MIAKRLHQVVDTVLPWDATSDHVFLIRGWLREMGYESEIYAMFPDSSLADEVKQFDMMALSGEELVVFHHTTGSAALDKLIEQRIPLILIYHNITPPKFFAEESKEMVARLEKGRSQLRAIRKQTRLALGASGYSERELRILHFERTGVLPIVLDKKQLDLPIVEDLFKSCQTGGPLLLFVGRISPNKRQEDLLKLLTYYRRIEADAHLVLVGNTDDEAYMEWLRTFIAEHNLAGAVTFAGHVSQEEMVTYYKAADLFVSMSEHEGFGKPLIESMYLGLPVMAYAATAVPSTLGGAGVLFTEKAFEPLAEMVDMLVKDQMLRRQLTAAQRERVRAFLEPVVRGQWQQYLEDLAREPIARKK
ncbi:MAG: glycosyltransferase family 4 protein [Candidatus Promineifilaceae bacterium]